MFGRRRKKRELEIERELRSHLDLEAEEQQEAGLAPTEARYAAQRSLGNFTLIKENVRESWGFPLVDRFIQDLAFAFRLFRKTPGFTAIAVLTLALGIGGATAAFSVFSAVLLRPLPYGKPDRLAVIWDRDIHVKGTSKLFDLYTDYDNYKKNSRAFTSVTAFSWAPQASPTKIFTGAGPAQSIFALPVTPDFFSALGVEPMLGRTFTPGAESHGCEVVLAYHFWQTALGGQNDAPGKTIRLDNQSCTVLGVMPPNFAFLPPGATVAMWINMTPPSKPQAFAVGIVARLRPQVSMPAAQAEVTLLNHHLHEHDEWGAKTEPVLYDLHEEFVWLTGRNLKLTLILLFASVSAVLLICCVNVANLLLGRAVARQREMGIRAALGSERGTLIRQLLTESLALAFLASLLGTALAATAVHYFKISSPIGIPPATDIALNTHVLAFALFLSIATALTFGLAPAWRAAKVDLNEVLKAGGRNSSRTSRQLWFSKALIVAEVMLTLVLLAGAGMLMQSLDRFSAVPLGFKPESLLLCELQLPPNAYTTPESRIQLYAKLQARLSDLSGVQGAAFSSTHPIDGGGPVASLKVEGHPAPRPDQPFDTFQQSVSADYFHIMQMPLEEGRFFNQYDRNGHEPVAIINREVARRYFPSQDPVGKHIRTDNAAPWWTVVGVVGNEKRTTVFQEMAWVDPPIVYRPLDQDPGASQTVLVRTNHAVPDLDDRIQRAVAAIDSNIPVGGFQAVMQLRSKALAYPTFRAILLAGFASLALILAVMGLFGVLAHSVAQRTAEIGIRLALGAQALQVLKMVIREGMLLAGAGILLGLGEAWLLGRFLATLLYDVRPVDPFLLLLTSLLLLGAALVGIYIPAQRASSVDPTISLRCE